MSVTTILVPADLVEAIRESLLAARRDIADELSDSGSRGPAAGERPSAVGHRRERLDVVERLLEQMTEAPGSDSAPRQLAGPRPALWSAAYEPVCNAAEQLADMCNDYWHGTIASSEVRALIAEVAARFDLLDSLGPPSVAQTPHEGQGGD